MDIRFIARLNGCEGQDGEAIEADDHVCGWGLDHRYHHDGGDSGEWPMGILPGPRPVAGTGCAARRPAIPRGWRSAAAAATPPPLWDREAEAVRHGRFRQRQRDSWPAPRVAHRHQRQQFGGGDPAARGHRAAGWNAEVHSFANGAQAPDDISPSRPQGLSTDLIPVDYLLAGKPASASTSSCAARAQVDPDHRAWCFPAWRSTTRSRSPARPCACCGSSGNLPMSMAGCGSSRHGTA